MTRDDASKNEFGAAQLGRLARVIDGSVDAAENDAGRERLVMAIGTRRGLPKRWLSVAATAAVLLV